MKMSLRWMIAAFVMMLGTGWSAPALAWGDSGHRTVCEIALLNLTPTARSAVDRLLAAQPAISAGNPLRAQYGWACTYPDHPAPGPHGRRSPEHFVNYARTTLTVTSATGCGVGATCILSAIPADLAILSSTTAPDADRAWALVYLGHWLGDVHQPLHSSFMDDRGGNEVNVSGLCTSSLHSTWDTCMLQSRALAGGTSVPQVQALAASWNALATPAQRATPWQWSAESYAVTLQPWTGYCVMVGSACQYSGARRTWATGVPRRGVAINGPYVDRAMPIIQQRITQAGVRLAHLLNQALDPAYSG
jgi:nuclease S1